MFINLADAELQYQIKACRLCSNTFDHEPKPLVWGDLAAPVLILGQAPSRSGHLTQKPWNDASGRLLRQWLGVTDDVFYDPTRFYLTAMAHCFPGKSANGSGDKLPPKICWQTWVQHELQQSRATLVITVGRLAAQALHPCDSFTALVFDNPYSWQDKQLVCLPHPSPANRRWLRQHPTFETDYLPSVRHWVSLALR